MKLSADKTLALNGGMMMNWKLCGRRWSWHISMYYPSIYLERLMKTHEKRNQDGRCPSKDSNQHLPIQVTTCANLLDLFLCCKFRGIKTCSGLLHNVIVIAYTEHQYNYVDGYVLPR